ncbi:hypothetical protein GCM10009558_042190 [Virgisporangium aurantiacum]
MSRDHSTTAWTPDWLGESPGPADQPTDGPAHAAPDLDDETRELEVHLDAADLAEEPFEPIESHEPRRSPIREPRRPLVSEGWAEERGRPTSDRPTDPEVGSLRALSAVAVTGRRPVRPPSSPIRVGRRGPHAGSTAGLVALVLLALVSAFFAWVTAEPLWLAVGHSQPGVVTVTRCTDGRCLGTFTGTSKDFVRDGVPVMGDAPVVGQTAPARMTSDPGIRAYVDVDPNSRALVGFALILLCGLGIVRATAVRRLPTRPARRIAALLSLGGPLLLLAAMLAATY